MLQRNMNLFVRVRQILNRTPLYKLCPIIFAYIYTWYNYKYLNIVMIQTGVELQYSSSIL